MKNKKNQKKSLSPAIVTLKTILIILTIVYPLFMVIMSGAGLVYNRESYGEELTRTGILLIASGIIMTLGSFLCVFRKNIASIICSCGGFALCMAMLYKLVEHADSAGWTNKFTLEAISSMYIHRIVPTAAPFIIAVTVSLIQFFSYEASEQRRLKKKLKEENENKPAPPII